MKLHEQKSSGFRNDSSVEALQWNANFLLYSFNDEAFDNTPQYQIV